MGRIFGILLFVLALWFVAQQFVEVTPVPGDAGATTTIPQRVKEKVTQAHQQDDARRRKLLGE